MPRMSNTVDNGPANWLTVVEAAEAYRLSERTLLLGYREVQHLVHSSWAGRLPTIIDLTHYRDLA